jgi:hypothetical protein
MPEGDIQSIKKTADEFDMRPDALGEVVRRLGLEVHPMSNGRAKGLDGKARAILAKRLKPVRKPK